MFGGPGPTGRRQHRCRVAGNRRQVLNNTLTSECPIDYIAQNGTQVSYGATGLVRGNTVSGNYYTPDTNEACGLLFYPAGNTVGNNALTNSNKVSGNELPLYLYLYLYLG